MPRSSKPGWIPWRTSKARGIILRDLMPGGALDGMDNVKAEDVFNYYKRFPEFEHVVLSQFQERLHDHRKQSKEDRVLAARDEEATRKDRQRFPRANRNDHNGKLVFDVHSAKKLLREDIKNGLHKHIKPFEMQQTRPEYKEFEYRIFKHRIYQEVRRQKFLHYLEVKRQKEFPLPTGEHTKDLNDCLWLEKICRTIV